MRALTKAREGTPYRQYTDEEIERHEALAAAYEKARKDPY
jgi:hypothetical protein